ncbi:MAG: hypothetical protein LUD72_14140 [Bacteroidales bacterium]|nr:hypothetical protein [Bacteroidales bacterium]
MEKSEKKRAVVSYENMNEELAAAFAEKYPKGFSEYFPDLVKYDKPDGSFFYAVTVETESAIYLVKIQVRTDAAEDIERWLEEESEDSDGTEEGGEGEDLPDSDISQYSSESEEEPAE